jgi:superfamily II DNA or RNA helicase
MDVIKRKQHFIVKVENEKENVTTTTFSNFFFTKKSVYDKQLYRYVETNDKLYIGRVKIIKTFSFPISMFNNFKKFILKNINKPYINIVEHNKIPSTVVEYDLVEHFKPYEYQKEIAKNIVETTSPTSVIVLQTGKGKGLTALYTLSLFNKKAIFILQARYVNKWIEEIIEKTTIDRDEILLIRGSVSLSSLLKNEEYHTTTHKIVIITMKTMMDYIISFEEQTVTNKFKYDVTPFNFLEIVKIDTILIDEVHEMFNGVMKSLMYLNPNKFIGLTGTLYSIDSLKNLFQKIIFPEKDRYNTLEYDAYVSMFTLFYNIENVEKVRYEQNDMYNHIKFEQSVMKNKSMYNNYLTLIYTALSKFYLTRKSGGEKALMYVSSVEYAGKLTEELSAKTGLIVSQFTQGVDDSVLKNSDIIVTTVIKAAANFDIKNLITTIMTTSLKNPVTNEQIRGRLRNLVSKLGKKMIFCNIVSNSIQKQVEFHNYNKHFFINKVKEYTEINYKKEI